MPQTTNDIKNEELEVVERPEDVKGGILYKTLEKDIDSDKYIVYLDGKSTGYVDNEDDAISSMYTISKQIQRKYMNYDTLVTQPYKDKIEVLGKYRFFVIGCDQVLAHISYTKVKKIFISEEEWDNSD